LRDRNYYLNESDITRAYRQHMRDLALALTNDVSMVNNDVDAIFEFEQLISKVILYSCTCRLSHFILNSTFGRLSNKVLVMKKRFEQQSVICRLQSTLA
jgi:hypothetical protein